jgi:hypothetical protein
MIIELGDGTKIKNPSAAQVEEAIRSLPGGDDSLAYLEQAYGVFIQAFGGVSDRGFYMLEYRDGADELHFRYSKPGLETDEVVRAFIAYLQGRDDYKRDFPWQPIAVARRANRLRLVVPIALIIGAFVVWWLLARFLH